MPDATAAAEPPLDPPVEWAGFHGLWVAPKASGSVVGTMPSSGVLVLPTKTNPEARNRPARYEYSCSTQPAFLRNWLPSYIGSPAEWAARSLRTMGTPRKGPSSS